MTQNNVLATDSGVDVSLALLSSMLIEVRDLVLALDEVPQGSSLVLDDVNRGVVLLRLNYLLLSCSAWLIERSSSVSDRSSGTEANKLLPKISLKDKLDACGYLDIKPASLLEAKVHDMCARLMRLDRWH